MKTAIEPYRRLFRLPGVPSLVALGLVTRIPATATGLTIWLHAADTLEVSALQAGVVSAASTVGIAVGSPLLGRVVDRRGVRPVVAVTTLAQVVFWLAAPSLPYEALVAAAFVGGLLMLPVFGLIRQCVAAMVPKEQHRTGFALDSMCVELSYMIGPAVGAAAVSLLSSTVAMRAVGVGFALAGLGLYLLDPPSRSAEELAEGPQRKVPTRHWLNVRVLTIFGVTAALTFVLTATDLAIVATLQRSGDTVWIGLVIGLWCFASLVGGFVYGVLPRGFSPLVMIGGLCALTIPVGFVGGGWWWLIPALIPGGLLCAPSLSTTVDYVNKSVPAAARGESMGMHGTFLTIGVSLAGPVAGLIIDAWGPKWAFTGAGLIGLVLVLVAVPFWRMPVKAAEPVEVPA
ncbi:MFS transporter [Herbidospora sp. NBRC 101105]|uniref:MFS transporter n=1 Tax=Herbidospora sp. NBRC 101105 TaxID=3032195 RepID=UPI00249FB888|nr:MFS transporter [Herbidospora sp. NBRC 101105]GLX92506.1 MFS transporter [Herbidospora sp. NBRC 101105]